MEKYSRITNTHKLKQAAEYSTGLLWELMEKLDKLIPALEEAALDFKDVKKRAEQYDRFLEKINEKIN